MSHAGDAYTGQNGVNAVKRQTKTLPKTLLLTNCKHFIKRILNLNSCFFFSSFLLSLTNATASKWIGINIAFPICSRNKAVKTNALKIRQTRTYTLFFFFSGHFHAHNPSLISVRKQKLSLEPANVTV